MSTSLKAACVAPLRSTNQRELTEQYLREAAKSEGANRARLQNAAIELNMDLASSIAARYSGRGQDRQDLSQVAAMGLVKAVRRFDPERGDFFAYAVPTMVGELKRYFRDRCWSIRPPRRVQELQAEALATASELGQKLRRTPKADDLAECLGVGSAAVAEALNAHDFYSPASLDAPRGPGLDASLLHALPEQEDGYERAEAFATVASACRKLPARDRRLIYLRFFCDKTQQEIADEFGVTQMQISRMQKRILGSLREAIDGDIPKVA